MAIYTFNDALMFISLGMALGAMIGWKIKDLWVRHEIFEMTADQIMEVVDEALRNREER